MKKNYLLIITGIILVLIDQLTKLFFTGKNYDYGFFAFTYVENTGISFGMLQGTTTIMVFVSIIVLFALIYFKKEFKEYEWFHVLLVAGTLGNLIDRALRGYVVDFINLKWWPVFNVADSLLFIGVFGIIITYIVRTYFIKN